jgi:hypothetical protein
MIPKPKKLRFHERKVTHAVLGGLGVLAAGAGKIVPDLLADVWTASTSVSGIGLLVASAAVVVATLKAKDDDAEASSATNHLNPIKASVHTLYGALRALDNERTGARDDDAHWRDRLRITLHQCVGNELEQVLDYVGGTGGKAGRKFSGRSGVIGDAVVSQDSIFWQRVNKDDEDYRRELTANWGYPRNEAMELRSDRWSFAAVPLVVGEQVVAVLYLDSSDPDFFTSNRKVIEGACQGLARYGRLAV